ncbi:MAG: TetR/AcrR family transcriptional regulator [Acidimicrobiales bacterium]|jgi:AcrR family transcriptional regulator
MSPVGRPRADPRTSTADPQEEILRAAAELFASEGYTATSTRAIAQAVGLRQASLFHYYPRKEAILAELLDRTLRPTLEMSRRLERAALGPEATLWVLAERDVGNLCAGPHNLGALQLLPEARGDQFAWFWRRRQRLSSCYRRAIRTGTEIGLFPAATRATAPDLVFGLVESVITAKPVVRADPATPALVADSALRMLGVTPARLERARSRAVWYVEHDLEAEQATLPTVAPAGGRLQVPVPVPAPEG